MNVAKYKTFVLTSDTIEALKILENKNNAFSFYQNLSMTENETWAKTRRCVVLSGERKKIWSFAVPLGFTPHDRFPVEAGSDVYWYFGPWQGMMDRLMSIGRGDAVWESFLCASQLETGTWDKTDRFIERSIQMHLHRLGYNPGPIDGVIGPTTTKALQKVNIRDRLELALQKLQRIKTVKPSKKTSKVSFGEMIFPETCVNVQSYGDLRVTRKNETIKIQVNGEGRLIVDLRH